MNEKIQIVQARSEDASAVVMIFREARADMTYLPTVHTPKETSDYFSKLVRDGKIQVIKENGVTAGFVQAEDGWIHHLYIAPCFQKKGFGKLLLDKAKETNPAGLQLWVFEANIGAIKFYEREGFVLVQKRDQEKTTNEENLPDRKYQWKPKSHAIL